MELGAKVFGPGPMAQPKLRLKKKGGEFPEGLVGELSPFFVG